jgi:hypothetical protein
MGGRARSRISGLFQFTLHLFGKDIGLFGNTGYLLMHRGTATWR